MNLPISSKKSMVFAIMRRSLLAWFRSKHASLPWRKNNNPYRIWVSEVMLQQTRVAVVVPYYKTFLREFPTIRKLAHSGREHVLKLWAGMGYYQRAENLHRTAQILLRQYGGKFPSELEKIKRLPGIGDYTARAILSIAYKQPLAVMDGNVARVISRIYRLSGDPSRSSFKNNVSKRLDNLLSRRSPGNFNQAIMELGQTICLPRSPQCSRCPLRNSCAAYQYGDVERFPAHPRRRKSRRVYLASLVLQSGSKVLMVRGLKEGLLKGLWNFPSAFGDSRGQALTRLQGDLTESIGRCLSPNTTVLNLEHRITFRVISVDIYKVRSANQTIMNGSRWMDLRILEGVATSALARKVCAVAMKHERKLSVA